MKKNLLIAAAAVSVALVLDGCNQNDPASLIASAKAYFAKSDYNAGIIQLKTALQSAPDNAEARFLLGKAFAEAGDGGAAEVELRKAIELKYPGDEVKVLLAQAMLLQNEPAKLITQFKSQTLSTPESRSQLGSLLARAYLATGDVPAARAALDKVLSDTPKDVRALTLQAD